MWLVPFALALPPAVCPPGLFPARDGRCTGSETPWGGDRPHPRYVFLANGRVVLLDSGRIEADRWVPSAGLSIDPGDGDAAPVPLAFAAAFADRIVQRRNGEIVAFRGSPGGGEPGEIGVRRLAGQSWVEVGNPPPSSLATTGLAEEADGNVLFVGPTATLRWSPSRGSWTALPALPEPRLWPVVLPGTGGPIACGGVTSAARDAVVVPGCVALNGGRWKPVKLGIELGGDAYAVPVGAGLAVLDPEAKQAWWFADGVLTPRDLPPGVEGWTSGAGRLVGLDDQGRRITWDPAVGTARTDPPPGRPEAWAGLLVALDADRAFYAGTLADGAGMGVVDAAHPALIPMKAGMFATAARGPGEVLLLSEARLSRWAVASRRFEPLPDLPAPRSSAALVPMGAGSVLLAGGRDRDDASNRAWVLDGQAWREVASLPTTLVDASGVRLADGSVLVAGKGPSKGTAFRYDPKRNAWAEAPPPEHGIGRLVPLPNGVAWVRDDDTFGSPAPTSVAFWREGAWKAVDPVPHVNAEVAILGLSDGSLVAAGGRIGDDYGGTDATWRLPPGASRWEPMPPLVHPRWGATLTELSPGRLLLVGGRGPCELFDGTRWVQASPLARERRSPFAFALDATTALVFGGYSEGKGGPDVELYRVVGSATAWPDPPLPDPRLAGADPALVDALLDADIGCTAGDVKACAKAAAIWEAPPLNDAKQAAERRRQACQWGDKSACPP